MKIIIWNINRFDGVWDWYEKKKDKCDFTKNMNYREKRKYLLRKDFN